MKSRFFPIFLIFAIIFIVAFGFLGMSFMDHGGLFTCPFSIIGAGDCSSITNTLALVSHHVSGLQSLTQAVFDSGITILALSFLLLVVSSLISLKLLQKNLHIFFYQKFQIIESSDFVPNRIFLKWLALHNKRDLHALQWVRVKT